MCGPTSSAEIVTSCAPESGVKSRLHTRVVSEDTESRSTIDTAPDKGSLMASVIVTPEDDERAGPLITRARNRSC